MIRHYTLPPDQIARALEAGGPLVDLQVDPEKLKTMSVAVVEVDGQIVAYWVCWYALHLEPLWIHEAHRKSPGVVAGIIDAMRQIAEGTGEPAGFCVIEAENLEVVSRYAERLGFQEAPGKLYYVLLQQPAVEPVKG